MGSLAGHDTRASSTPAAPLSRERLETPASPHRDARIELDDASAPAPQEIAAHPTTRPAFPWLWTAATALVAAVLAGVLSWFSRASSATSRGCRSRGFSWGGASRCRGRATGGVRC